MNLSLVIPDEIAHRLGAGQRGKRPPLLRIGYITAPMAGCPPGNPGADSSFTDLDAGQTAAIALAMACHADLLLMDDRRSVNTARSKGFQVAGTLAMLGMAARRKLLDLAAALERLK